MRRTRVSVLLVITFATALMVLSHAARWSDGTRYAVGGLMLVVVIPLLLAWQDGLIMLKLPRRRR